MTEDAVPQLASSTQPPRHCNASHPNIDTTLLRDVISSMQMLKIQLC